MSYGDALNKYILKPLAMKSTVMLNQWQVRRGVRCVLACLCMC